MGRVANLAPFVDDLRSQNTQRQRAPALLPNMFINPDPAFDLVKDFVPISLLASGAVVLVVSPQSNLKSVSELIALAKSKPDQVLCANAGIGSLPHMAAELFAQRAGIKVVNVPYPGSPQAVTDVLPEVPTMAEAGMPDFDTSLWFGVMAPAGTPQTAIEKIASAAEKAMHGPPLGEGPEAFGHYARV
jgi:tripartite-type tricarboxylate transporter receptor subunit TctC